MVETTKQHSINPARKLLVSTFVAVLISGCTSSRVEDLSAASTHAGIEPPPVSSNESNLLASQQQPIRENVEIDNRITNETLAPEKVVNPENTIARKSHPRVTNFYSPVNRSGVDYRQIEDLPVRSQPKLQNNSMELLGQRQLTSQQVPARVASLGDISPVASVDQKERAALQRISVLDARIEHSSCKNGWATQPDKLDASETTAGHPFYMEMRMRHTPMLPVGHTYIAYGRLSPSGEPLEERLIMLSPVGGYGGAAIAAALPMPGVLKPVSDDCRLKPIAAYRVTLSAVEYEKLLLRIYQARSKTPAYSLFAYNCNHFASDIAAAVGILPPKNKYLPALKYIYGVIENNKSFASQRKYPT